LTGLHPISQNNHFQIHFHSAQTLTIQPFNLPSYIPRILVCIASMACVYFVPSDVLADKANHSPWSSSSDKPNQFPFFYYFMIVVISIFVIFISTMHFVAAMSFFATISAKDIGGIIWHKINETIRNGS
jgi:hypothetical protein